MTTSLKNDGEYDTLRREAANVLVNAIADLMSSSGRQPTASEVRIKLRDLTHDGFDPKRLGFVRFRDFLDYAERYGTITLDRGRPGDISVGLANFEPAQTAASRTMRRDLWHAFLKWSNDFRFYDRTTDSIKNVPREVAPLEPVHFAQLRTAVNDEPERYVAITPIDRDTQIGWMHTFADEVPDAEVKRALLVALGSTNAAGEFVTALKSYPTELRRWYDYLTKHVQKTIESWLSQSELEVDIWKQNEVESPQLTEGQSSTDAEALTAEAAKTNLRSWLRHGRVEGAWSTRPTASRTTDVRLEVKSVEQLRQVLHSAIDRMPADQLRLLSIPLGYLIDL
jgi:hypothetical protein